MRIAILDGFRALAILSVLFYHYFSRWTPPNHSVSFYPYNDNFNYFFWGKFGVQFFFLISGFVIYFTLEKTDNFSSFWKKRLARLLPSIIVASLITYIFFISFDETNIFPDSLVLGNFIPSLLFINPVIINNIFGTNLAYLNGSYWSLWPEIQFYFLISIVFYYNKNKFLNNFIFISIFIIIIHHLLLNIQDKNVLNISISFEFLNWYNKWIVNGFNLVTYLPFFSAGVVSYVLFDNHNSNVKNSMIIKIYVFFIIAYIIYSGVRMPTRIVYIFIISIFATFIYFPTKLKVFERPVFTSIGESSYFLYLIHEHIGVFLIFITGNIFLLNTFVFPLLLIVFFTIISILYYRLIDKRFVKIFKR
jgi:peptidoglycan/LPS O-acetylase OafA/YrhL